MGKDPAFMFYSQDFIVGTLTMSLEDRGRYITLLSVMHQKGRLSEQSVGMLVGNISDELRDKFITDKNGLWFNERLEFEMKKREGFIKDQRKRANKRWDKHDAKAHAKASNPALPDSIPKECLSSSSSSSSSSSISNSKKDIEPPPATPHHVVIDHFKVRFEKHCGTKWHVDGGKVGSMVQKLLRTYSAEKICEMIDKFFDLPGDDFLDKSGRDFGIFYTQVNKLSAEPKPQKTLAQEAEEEWQRKYGNRSK